jgi:K+-transporting ATPase ATPase C chain
VADARKMSVDKLNAMIDQDQYTDAPSLGFLGEAGVNVLRLNLALDQVAPVAAPAPTTAPAAPTTQP